MRSSFSGTAALTAVMVVLLFGVIAALLVLTDPSSPPGPPAAGPSATPEASATIAPETPRPTRTTRPGQQQTCVAGARKAALTVVTFNIHSAREHDGSVNLARIAAELEAWDADVILLQEVDRYRLWTGQIDMPVVLADQLDMAWTFGANVQRSARNSYGTAILSRYPVESFHNTLLPAPPGTQQRGLLRATIDVDGIRISVYGTHLEHTSADARLQQMRVIAPILRADPLPKIFGGDLNARPGSPVLDAVTNVARDTWATVGVGSGLTHPVDNPRTRIDFLLYAGGSTADLVPLNTDVLDSAVSDHRAVWASYQLTTADGDVCIPVVPEQDQG